MLNILNLDIRTTKKVRLSFGLSPVSDSGPMHIAAAPQCVELVKLLLSLMQAVQV